MILAAGLLVLLGLGSFVGGVVTGTTALYWACVAACGAAAVVLVAARLRMPREAGEVDRSAARAGARAHPAGSRAPGAGRTEPPPGTGAEPEAAVPRTPERPRKPAGATAVRRTEPAGQPEPGVEPAPAAPRLAEPAAAPPEAPLPVAEPAPAVPLGPAAGDGHPGQDTPARRGAHQPREVPADPETGEPGEEDVELTDLLLVIDLTDEVLVVDEHPRYHLPGCPHLEGREDIGLPMVEARADGFTPCATCCPVRHLADTERSRRQAARGS